MKKIIKKIAIESFWSLVFGSIAIVVTLTIVYMLFSFVDSEIPIHIMAKILSFPIIVRICICLAVGFPIVIYIKEKEKREKNKKDYWDRR